MRKALFLTMEGGEGSGKTTIISRIQAYLEENGMAVMATREPGGIAISEQIRAVLLDKNNVAMDGRTEALLYAAARRQHLVEKIIPALNQGTTVICDRFIDSSLAYQGYARGLGMDEILAVNAFAVEGNMPQLTFLLDLDPEIGLARIQANQHREINRLDLESIQFHNKVREGYLLASKRFPERIVLINANQSSEQVFNDIRDVLSRYITV